MQEWLACIKTLKTVQILKLYLLKPIESALCIPIAILLLETHKTRTAIFFDVSSRGMYIHITCFVNNNGCYVTMHNIT